MRIVSWNVNGLRACVKKGFLEFLETSDADVVALQEVRAFSHQLDTATREPEGWYTYFAPAQRPGYAGVAIYARQPAIEVIDSLAIPRFDQEGRFLVARFGRLFVVSVYFPKGSGKDRDNSRVPYKLDFYRAVFSVVQSLRRRGPVDVVGDYNTAHSEIDLARPTTNRKARGFLLEERAEIDRWLDAGWVDVFRHQHQGKPGHYTWWRQWGNARQDNVGWRIDYVLASPGGAKRIDEAFIWPHVKGSDHCPIGVTLLRSS